MTNSALSNDEGVQRYKNKKQETTNEIAKLISKKHKTQQLSSL